MLLKKPHNIKDVLCENKIPYQSIANLLNRSREGVRIRANRLYTSKGEFLDNEIDDNHESYFKNCTV